MFSILTVSFTDRKEEPQWELIRIKTSKNGISILLLFMVKRIWSFKELSSV
jgi:hypothetical protein